MSEPTDTQRLDKLAAYLSNSINEVLPPKFNGAPWKLVHIATGEYFRDGQGPTLRDAIDSLPDEKGKL